MEGNYLISSLISPNLHFVLFLPIIIHMDEFLSRQELSRYNKYILNKILPGFCIGCEFNIYELVSDSVSYKCILPSQNELIMETFYSITEYLITNHFITERKEMSSYLLTGKGIDLKNAGSVEKFEERSLKKSKKNFFQTLFSKDTYRSKTPGMGGLVEHYE